MDLFLAGSDLPPPELSDDALPQSWAEIVRAYAAVAEAPPDYVAITAIAGAAGAIGNACVVEGKRGWREPAVLWGMPIGPPSAHKTPAMKAAHSALAAIDHELYVEWKRECEQIEVQHQMALDAQEAANKSKKTVKKPEKPPLKASPARRYVAGKIDDQHGGEPARRGRFLFRARRLVRFVQPLL